MNILKWIPGQSIIEVVHGWKDEIVPVENVYKFCRGYFLNLKIINDRHNLQERIHEIEGIFKEFLGRISENNQTKKGRN